MLISIDEGLKFPCSSEPVRVVPGKHSVMGITAEGFNMTTVDAHANQESDILLCWP